MFREVWQTCPHRGLARRQRPGGLDGRRGVTDAHPSGSIHAMRTDPRRCWPSTPGREKSPGHAAYAAHPRRGARRALLRSRLPRRLRARTRRLRAEKGGAGRRQFLILLRLLRLTIPAISILGHGHFSRMFVRSPDRRRRALRPALARPGDAGVRQSPAAPAVMRPSARVRSPATVLGSLPATIDHNDVPG